MRRPRVALLIGAVCLLAAGCGAGRQSAAVSGPTTTVPVASPSTAPSATAGPATTAAPTTAAPPSSAPPTSAVATTTTSGTAAVSACTGSDLEADQVVLSEGASQYYLAWSLTNTSGAPCQVPAGVPTVAFDNAAGDSVVHYETSSLGGGSSAALTVQPAASVWFLTEELDPTTCTGVQTVGGGPFHYDVTLPDGAGVVEWAPSYLDEATLSDYCPTVPLGVGGLQSSKPTAP